MGDWLGTGNIRKKNFLPFEDARKFARKLKLSGSEAWRKWRNSGENPDDIPSSPAITYKDCWISWGDFLGTENVANQNRNFLPFGKARKFARNLKLNRKTAWVEWCKAGKKPDDIPSNPNKTYKDSGWVGIRDWLGTAK